MTKKILIVIVVIVGILGGFWVYSQTMQEETEDSQKPSTISKSEPNRANDSSRDTSSTTALKGQYIEYTDTIVATTKGTKILFFHAPWCPQCRQLEESIKSGEIPDNVSIIKVDYDSNQSLRKKYGVTIQTTLVRVDDQGNLVEKFVAYTNPNLNSIKTNLL